MVKHLPTMQETRVRSLGGEDPLEKEMATHFSILAWRIPWTEEPARLQSMGSQRVRHDWATSLTHSQDDIYLHFLYWHFAIKARQCTRVHVCVHTLWVQQLPQGQRSRGGFKQRLHWGIRNPQCRKVTCRKVLVWRGRGGDGRGRRPPSDRHHHRQLQRPTERRDGGLMVAPPLSPAGALDICRKSQQSSGWCGG